MSVNTSNKTYPKILRQRLLDYDYSISGLKNENGIRNLLNYCVEHQASINDVKSILTYKNIGHISIVADPNSKDDRAKVLISQFEFTFSSYRIHDNAEGWIPVVIKRVFMFVTVSDKYILRAEDKAAIRKIIRIIEDKNNPHTSIDVKSCLIKDERIGKGMVVTIAFA